MEVVVGVLMVLVRGRCWRVGMVRILRRKEFWGELGDLEGLEGGEGMMDVDFDVCICVKC